MRGRQSVLMEIVIIVVVGAIVSLFQTLWLRQRIADTIEEAQKVKLSLPIAMRLKKSVALF